MTDNKMNDSYDHIFKSDSLTYTSLLTGFNQTLFDTLNLKYEELKIDNVIQSLFSGKKINTTENQAAIHHVYREAFSSNPNNFLSADVIESAKSSILTCIELKNTLQENGIKNIVTIGIGGSFEGPKLLLETLTEPHKRLFNHIFLTGPDILEFEQTVKLLNKNETFFIVSSKSFSTDETLQSINLAKDWISSLDNPHNHFLAVTAQTDKAKEHGFTKQSIITFPNEVGGRYSLWSPISLPAILEMGTDFLELLKGAAQADYQLINDIDYKNFIKTISFSDIWFNNFKDKATRVLLIYSWKLRFFKDYAQQLEMESIGKHPNKNSEFKKTGQVIFGGFGSTAQHSYFQLLHQGTASACSDIISIEDYKKSNKLLYAQAKTQAELLANGAESNLKDFEEVNGNIPVNFFSLNKLNAYNLGYLIATWEHRTFVTAAMLEINPFDQYGVSAGKIFTKKYLKKNGA